MLKGGRDHKDGNHAASNQVNFRPELGNYQSCLPVRQRSHNRINQQLDEGLGGKEQAHLHSLAHQLVVALLQFAVVGLVFCPGKDSSIFVSFAVPDSLIMGCWCE